MIFPIIDSRWVNSPSQSSECCEPSTDVSHITADDDGQLRVWTKSVKARYLGLLEKDRACWLSAGIKHAYKKTSQHHLARKLNAPTDYVGTLGA